MKCEVTIHYTVDDDGIHLYCSCGWHICLGFEPTIEQAAKAASEHVNSK